MPLVDVLVSCRVGNSSPELPRRRCPRLRAARRRRCPSRRLKALDGFLVSLACSRCNPRINPWPDARFRVFPGEVAARRRRAPPLAGVSAASRACHRWILIQRRRLDPTGVNRSAYRSTQPLLLLSPYVF